MNGLRFSLHNDTEAVRIELGGSLTGADVETVYQAWQSEAWTEPFKPVILDITAVTEADKHGRALLVMINRFGAEIIARSLESSAIVRPLVSALFKRLKIPKTKGGSMHVLRRTLASQMLDGGVPLPVVSARLGHSSIRTTAEIYSHAIHGQDDEATRRLEEYRQRNRMQQRVGVQ